MPIIASRSASTAMNVAPSAGTAAGGGSTTIGTVEGAPAIVAMSVWAPTVRNVNVASNGCVNSQPPDVATTSAGPYVSAAGIVASVSDDENVTTPDGCDNVHVSVISRITGELTGT